MIDMELDEVIENTILGMRDVSDAIGLYNMRLLKEEYANVLKYIYWRK